jgi:hypothetical protein
LFIDIPETKSEEEKEEKEEKKKDKALMWSACPLTLEAQ